MIEVGGVGGGDGDVEEAAHVKGRRVEGTGPILQADQDILTDFPTR